MEVILEIIDWILRITGLVSIIIISINLFIKEYEYIDNVKIIANPTENELNECKIYEEYISEEKSVEKTKACAIFNPVNIPEDKWGKSFQLSIRKAESGKLRLPSIWRHVSE